MSDDEPHYAAAIREANRAFRGAALDRWDLEAMGSLYKPPCQHDATYTGPLYLVHAAGPVGTREPVTLCLTCREHLTQKETQ